MCARARDCVCMYVCVCVCVHVYTRITITFSNPPISGANVSIFFWKSAKDRQERAHTNSWIRKQPLHTYVETALAPPKGGIDLFKEGRAGGRGTCIVIEVDDVIKIMETHTHIHGHTHKLPSAIHGVRQRAGYRIGRYRWCSPAPERYGRGVAPHEGTSPGVSKYRWGSEVASIFTRTGVPTCGRCRAVLDPGLQHARDVTSSYGLQPHTSA